MANVTAPPILDSTGVQIANKLQAIQSVLAVNVTPATTASLGVVIPDGTTITVTAEGVISSAASVGPATTATAGIVKPDGTSILVDGNGTISANVGLATTAVAGTVKPDGTSITVANDGTISAGGFPISVDSGGYISITY